MNKLFTLLAVLTCATIAWATDYTVGTDGELRAAIQNNGANITVMADIDLSNSTLSIPEGTTVTINLNNHALDRRLTKRGEGGGQVITVREGATLNLSNGTLKGGWGGAGGALVNEGGMVTLTDVIITNNVADDRGGGICNREGGTLTMTGGVITDNSSNDHSGAKGGGGFFNEVNATATLTGVTLTGNVAKVYGGGGICNFGTLTIDGCTITGNTAGTYGGGIWQEGTLNMQGANTISDNKCETINNNLYLKSGKVITITGSLAGSKIGITMQTVGVFTSGYNTHNSGVDPATVFTSDETVFYVMRTADETGLALDYVECLWDDESKVVKSETKTLANGNYTVLKGGDDIDLQPGYYIVKSNVTYGTLNMAGNGVHHLILCDGARIKANFVHIIDDDVLHIYGQTNSSGQLIIDEPLLNCAGIGCTSDESVGTIVIHGGDISVHSGDGGSAGIGSSNHSSGSPVPSWRVPRHRSNLSSADDGTITIYDGTVKAYGGTNGSGIGGGRHSRSGTITINGGKVYAYGGDDAAGIGGGWDTSGYSLVVNGGYVEAHGGGNGAGIGSGSVQITNGTNVVGGEVTINGGEVYAYGGVDAAGIGGGEDANGGTVTITGGYVYAEGNDYGPGIGGGQDGKGGDVTITGGTVIAKAGRQYTPDVETENRAIGPGEGCDDYGTLTIGDNMMVQAGYDGDNYEGIFTANLRVSACWYRTSARIEPCTHTSLTYTVSGTGVGDTHTAHCKYCTTEFTPEQHTFVDNVCTVCGIEETTETHTVSYYLPNNSEYGEPTVYQYIVGETITLPTAPDNIVPVNLTFAGWHVGTPVENESFIKQPSEQLVAAGTEYTVDSDVSFAARYDYIHLTLNNAAHNGEMLARYNGKQAQDVTLKDRTLIRDGHWNTLCLPFDMALEGSPLEGATVKTLSSTSFDNGTLTLTFSDNVTSIEAGKPYIVKWGSGDDITDPVFENVTISNTLNPVATTAAEGVTVTFAGAYSPMFIGLERKNMLYLGPDNTLYYPSQAMTIGSCRAHFRLQGIEAGDLSANAIELNFGDETTGLSPNPSPNREGRWYSIDGRLLSGKPTAKGVYINNGHKIVIK